MKIMVNYDLIDKVREAKTGFSLQKYVTVVGLTNGLSFPFMLLGAYLAGADYVYVVEAMLKIFGYSLFYNAVNSFGFSFFRKERASVELARLATLLNNICVETDAELLKDAYKYDVEYRVKFDSFPPKIEQKKYIMVPVYNDWGNNERSLMQEHIIGAREYVLSYGEPEKNKAYSFAKRRVLGNNR